MCAVMTRVPMTVCDPGGLSEPVRVSVLCGTAGGRAQECRWEVQENGIGAWVEGLGSFPSLSDHPPPPAI